MSRQKQVQKIIKLIDTCETIKVAKKMNEEFKKVRELQINSGSTPSFRTATETMQYVNKPNEMDYRLDKLKREIAEILVDNDIGTANRFEIAEKYDERLKDEPFRCPYIKPINYEERKENK